MISSVVLKGHQKPVLCLDHSSSTPSTHSSQGVSTAALLSGSEDGTVRLWDLKGPTSRTSLCIKAPEDHEVLSVAFGPSVSKVAAPDTNPQSVSPFARQFSVFLAAGNAVYGYDLRKATSPLVTEPMADLSNLGFEDEINQIVFASASGRSQKNQRGNKRRHQSSASSEGRYLMAAGDDTGTVRILDLVQPESLRSLSTEPRTRVYSHETSPDQPAMVTSLAFRPRSKGVELVSGGTDCRVKFWDASKDDRGTKSLLATVEIPSSDAGANQVCNPPMIHSLQWSASGRLLAAGLGDGSIGIFQADSQTLVNTARLEDAHSGAVAAALFPTWQSSSISNNAVTAHDRLLCSTGNDGAIVLWDLGASLCGEKAIVPSRIFSTNTNDASEVLQSTMNELDVTDQPRALFAWQHTAKPNWLVSSRGLDPVFPSSLFLADTTNDITVYSIRTG